MQVVGITMKTWDYASAGGSKKETGCCSLDSINDARQLAVKFGFPHYILDLRTEFGDRIIDNFVEEYMAGRTPNPCVLCNTHIKWDALLRRADMMDCEFIATGHYAKVREENGRYVISKRAGRLEKTKAMYFGGFNKIALKEPFSRWVVFVNPKYANWQMNVDSMSLPKKAESYEICFIPDNDYRSFLKRRVNGLAEKVNDGDYVLADGTPMGKHKGYPFYTIGQRKGLDIAVGEPMFVTDIDVETNKVTLGTKEALEKDTMTVARYNIIKYAALPNGIEAHTKIRYKDPGAKATLPVRGGQNKGIFPTQSKCYYTRTISGVL